MIMSSDWCSPSPPPPPLLPPSFSSFLCVLSLLFTPPPSFTHFASPHLSLSLSSSVWLFLLLLLLWPSPLFVIFFYHSSFFYPHCSRVNYKFDLQLFTSLHFELTSVRINISPQLSSSSWSEKHTWRREADETAEFFIRVKCFILTSRGLAKLTSWSRV